MSVKVLSHAGHLEVYIQSEREFLLVLEFIKKWSKTYEGQL